MKIKKRPMRVKELLETGLLEGYPVFYNGGSKGIPLRGTIKGVRILCSCDQCKGTKVVTARQFEVHACKTHRFALAFICLENGKSLRDVVIDCRKGPLNTLEEKIKTIIGPVPLKKNLICRSCTGSFDAILAGKDEHGQLCDSCIISLRSKATPTHPMNTRNGMNKRLKMVDSDCISVGKVVNMDETNGNSGIPECNRDIVKVEVKEESKIRRTTLKPKMNPLKNSNGNSEGKVGERRSASKKLKIKIPKKRKKNSITVRELLMTGLLEGLPVFYNCGEKGVLLRGTIKGTGILCSCHRCKGNKVVTVEQFEMHACKVKKFASEYIFLENGKSLRDVVKECRKSSSKTLEETIKNIIGAVQVKKRLIYRNCKGSSIAALDGKDEHGQLCESCIVSLRSQGTPIHSMNSRKGRNKKLKMVDSNHNSSGKVLNMDETKGNSGIPASEEESMIRQSTRLTLKQKVEPMEFPNGINEGKLQEKSAVTTRTKKPKLKMSKKRRKISVMRKPRTTTDLFMTGLLEGLPVFYHGGKKGILLQGTIRGTGILCSCELCKGARVVTAGLFEIHAYKIQRSASKNICFENGKRLLDVIRECQKDSSMSLEETIRTVTGQHPVKKNLICEVCQAKSFLEPLCDSCVASFKSEASPTLSINTENGLERCREKIVLPMQCESSKKRSRGFHDLNVFPGIAPKLKQVKVERDFIVPFVIPKRCDPKQSDPIKKDAASKINLPHLEYLERRLGKLERLVAFLKSCEKR